MESGINGDQNFYSRPHVPPPTTPERVQQSRRSCDYDYDYDHDHGHDHNHEHDHHHASEHYHDGAHYDPSNHPELESRSPRVPPKLPFLTTQNLQAATAAANGYQVTSGDGGGGVLGGEVDHYEGFYRDYQGAQQTSHGYTEVSSKGMPGTTSDSRQAMPSTLRSNGHGSTPKNPNLPAVRSNLKPSYRSASSPLDDRVTNAQPSSGVNGVLTARQQPSVKELLRRFDQNNEQPSAIARKPSPRILTKDLNGPGYARERVGYQAKPAQDSQSSRPRAGTSTRDTGTGRVKSPPSVRTQRTRFATEDQHSNNTLSGTARAPRSKHVVSGNISQASKSMTNLSPTTPNPPPPRQPLFGEVLSSGQGAPGVAYGIPRIATRRTSDSSLNPSWIHQRNLLDKDIDPSSPTSWYLGFTNRLDDVNPTPAPRSTPAHNRNHSDLADNRVNSIQHIMPTFNTTAPTPTTPAQSSTSRLPLASHRLSGSSESSNTSSARNSRGSSPSARLAGSNRLLDTPDRRPWSPLGHSIPANRPHTPTRTPGRGRARTPEIVSHDNSRLTAYISAPPPKLSPPLRSSRPRQPVSSASTASSRRKVAEKTSPPQEGRTGMKVTRTGRPEHGKETKVSEPVIELGPVDFAARRLIIKRAYTKSIHESEQKLIRAENLRRLQERQKNYRDSILQSDDGIGESGLTTEVSPHAASPELGSTAPPEPLTVKTEFGSPAQISGSSRLDNGEDSPTLGIPGSFVDDDEPPPSAISTATGTTEIDNEPQTDPPRASRVIPHPQVDTNLLSSQVRFSEDHFSPEQAMYGFAHDNDGESINIMLDATTVDNLPTESTPTNDVFSKSKDPNPPGAFVDYVDYVKDLAPPIAPSPAAETCPDDSTPIDSRPTTPQPASESSENVNTSSTRSNGESFHKDAFPIVPEILYSEQPESPSVAEARHQLSLDTALTAPGLLATDATHESLSTPVTEIDYESSDGAGGAAPSERDDYDISFSNGELQPPYPNYRSSHHSSWTDVSVDSTDSHSPSSLHHVSGLAPEGRPPPPPKESLLSTSPVVPPKPDGYSPQSSPRFQSSSGSLPTASRQDLSPLSTENSYGVDFGDNIVSITPLWPEHPPPPPPASSSQHEKPSSRHQRAPPPPSLYNRKPPFIYQSASSDVVQTGEVRRGSEEAQSPRGSTYTPRSSTQISMDDLAMDQPTGAKEGPELTEEEKRLAEKDRKRLFQRRMVIKELIDTESVYLKDMNVVVEIYKGTAEACPKLDANDINTIFRNTSDIVTFSTKFLTELKSAGSSVYSTRQKSRSGKAPTTSNPAFSPGAEERISATPTLIEETDEERDRKTFVGANFGKHLKEMQEIYTDYLKNSELASSRLTTLMTDGAVKVWLSECNLVAKDLTAAWDLDALLVKPVQRITRYQLLLAQILEQTPEDHPDHHALQVTCREVASLLKNIDDLKKRIHMVGKIVGRKRKESDVRTGIAKAFGRRDKITPTANRPADDEAYTKLHDKFGVDYLRLQVVLRDVEFYTRQVATWVNDFLRYLSAMELVMRTSASPYPELESKWARFNMSMRDMGSYAIEDHVANVRKKVIEPFEQIIQLYNPVSLAMKKRAKRRLDYEKYLSTKASARDAKLNELVKQYEALNETLKLELPILTSKTVIIGNICLVQFVHIQARWYSIWQDKVKTVLEENQLPKDIADIIDMFSRDYKYVEARAQELGIVNGTFDSGSKPRASQSTQEDDSSLKTRHRPSNLSTRPRGLSLTSDKSPSLPTPDFAKRNSGQFSFSPIVANPPGLHQTNLWHQHSSSAHAGGGSHSPATPDPVSATPDPVSASRQHAPSSLTRPGTSRSYTSDNGMARQSSDYNSQYRRESGSTYSASHHQDGPPSWTRPVSGVFVSALPPADGPEESQRSSRTSSRDRNAGHRFNVLYLAASLFEFNISATKSEAGYPYLTYQAGEIFDVIGEKGELWLAKNQDDPKEVVGWIWSKHFARLASD